MPQDPQEPDSKKPEVVVTTGEQKKQKLSSENEGANGSSAQYEFRPLETNSGADYSFKKREDDDKDGDARALHPLFSLAFPVVTVTRMDALGLRGGKYMADHSRHSMAINADPFAVFMPCFGAAIEELTSDMNNPEFSGPGTGAHAGKGGPIDLPQLQQAYNALQESDVTNWEFTEKLDKINPNIAKYIYYILLREYGIKTSSSLSAASLTDNTTLFSRLDLAGVFPETYSNEDKISHLRGKMLATIERIFAYQGLQYTNDSNNSFSLVDNKPPNGPQVTLLTGTATKGEGGSYSMHIKFGENLSNDDFAKAMRQALIFTRQYTQHSSLNTCPITKLSTNPEHNILMVLIAVGEYHLHIPPGIFEPDKTADAIKRNYQDPVKQKEMLELWEWAKARAQLFEPSFVGSELWLNTAICQKLASEDPNNIHVANGGRSEPFSLKIDPKNPTQGDPVTRKFREKLQEILKPGDGKTPLFDIKQQSLFGGLPSGEAQQQPSRATPKRL